MEKSVILLQVRLALKLAMLEEIKLRKEASNGNFIVSQKILLEKHQNQKTVSRAIISMFPEIGKKPAEATDDDVIKLLKKYISQEKERLLYYDKHLTESDVSGISPSELKKLINQKLMTLEATLTSPVIEIAQSYLPKQASEDEIIEWIKKNLDLTQFKNKMQAMGPIMKQFKGCDGNFVKRILLKI